MAIDTHTGEPLLQSIWLLTQELFVPHMPGVQLAVYWHEPLLHEAVLLVIAGQSLALQHCLH